MKPDRRQRPYGKWEREPVRPIVIVLLLAPLLVSCSGRGPEVELLAKPHPLVDNLYIEEAVGDFGTTNLASGTFRLSGRCLTVNTGGAERTPVFLLPSGSVSPSATQVSLGGNQTIDYGVLYLLPGAVAGPPLRADRAGGCPRETVVVRSIEPADSVPQPKMPPMTPERR